MLYRKLKILLDEYWSNHPELHDIPIYYASSLAKKCMSVYQTYINAMNDRIRRQINISNPFVFKHISNLKVMKTMGDTITTHLRVECNRKIYILWSILWFYLKRKIMQCKMNILIRWKSLHIHISIWFMKRI